MSIILVHLYLWCIRDVYDSCYVIGYLLTIMFFLDSFEYITKINVPNIGYL